MPDRISVKSADFIRNIGQWQNEALRHPISITHHGRERLVLAAPEEFRSVRSDDATGAALMVLRADAGAVLDNLDEGYIHFDGDFAVRTTNAVGAAFLGRGKEDILGKSPLELFPQPLGAIVADRLQRVLRSRQADAFESGAFDGRHISVRVFPLTEGVALL
ncbi:MAG TPA: PAS domain-containing protein, partial [Verrucomicrobiae bacterium]|nr:PAS domain-containing protein [Verrucomicrobiae bacterium]